MAPKYQSLALALLGAQSASAVTVSFYLGTTCRGSPLGTYTAQYVPNGQCYDVPTNAQSAIVSQDTSDGQGVDAAFFENGCDSRIVATGDSGCLDFTGFGTNAQNWQLVTDFDSPGRARRDARPSVRRAVPEPAWASEQRLYRDMLNITDEELPATNLSPDWDPNVAIGFNMAHGNVSEYGGVTYKWQQVALGMTRGIPIEEWDDDVHVMSSRFIPSGDIVAERMNALSKRWLSETSSATDVDVLAKRDWQYNLCRALDVCNNSFAGFVLRNGWNAAVNAYDAARPYGTSLYDYLHNHPYTVAVATSFGTGYVVAKTTGSTATAEDNDQLANCSTDHSQASAFIQGLIDATDVGGYAAGEINITLPNGHILSLSAEIYDPNNKPDPLSHCNAP